MTQAVLDRIEADDEGDYLDWGGVGGTLAGNALSLAECAPRSPRC